MLTALSLHVSFAAVLWAPCASGACRADDHGSTPAPLSSDAQKETPAPVAKPQAPPVSSPAKPVAPATEPSAFELAVEAARTRASAALAEKSAELAAGDVEAVLSAVRGMLEGWEKDAAKALALGQALFPLDRDAAGSAHAALAKARELAPKERLVAMAWGKELARRGDHARAAEAYGEALAAGHTEPLLLHGLRTVVLLRAGDVEPALAEWQLAQPLQSRPALEAALREIHGVGDKEAERRALLARVRKDDLDAIEPLLMLDVGWTGTGEYPAAQRDYAKRDLALAAEKLGKDSRRYAELAFFVTGRISMEPPPKGTPPPPEPGRADLDAMGLAPSQVERTARKLGFMGYGKKDKHLPLSPVLAPAVYRMVFLDGDVVATEWIGWFEAELLARVRGEQVASSTAAPAGTATASKGDVEAGLLLLELYDQAIERHFDEKWELLVPKRAELEALLWERFKEARVAARILQRRANELSADDPVLKDAAERFPADLRIAMLAADAAKRAGKPSQELVVRRAQAAFAAADVPEAQRALAELASMRAKPAGTPPAGGK